MESKYMTTTDHNKETTRRNALLIMYTKVSDVLDGTIASLASMDDASHEDRSAVKILIEELHTDRKKLHKELMKDLV